MDQIATSSNVRGRGRGSGATGIGREEKGTGRGASYGSRCRYEDARSNKRITRSQRSQIEAVGPMGQVSIASWLGVSQSYNQAAARDSGRTDMRYSVTLNEGDQSDKDTESQPEQNRDIGRNWDRPGERDIGLFNEDDRENSRDGLQSSSDVKDLLLDIRQEMRYMNRKFDKLEGTMTTLKQDNKVSKRQNKQLNKRVEDLSSKLQTLANLARENELKNEKLESQSRRENLKFVGIEEARKETWEESEDKVRNYIAEGFNLEGTQIRIERAHRLTGSSSVTRPIIVKFSFFKDKDKILRAYWQKTKLMREQREQRLNGDSAANAEHVDNAELEDANG